MQMPGGHLPSPVQKLVASFLFASGKKQSNPSSSANNRLTSNKLGGFVFLFFPASFRKSDRMPETTIWRKACGLIMARKITMNGHSGQSVAETFQKQREKGGFFLKLVDFTG